MGQILFVTIGSMVDVITNSSSELFVCKTDKTLALVKQMLQELLVTYNNQFNRSLEFSECFAELKMMDVTAIKHEYGNYVEDNYWLNKMTADGTTSVVIIESTGDNSLPYALFDYIEALFSASRVHIG